MALCSKGFSFVKSLLDKVPPIIDKVLSWTSGIKSFEASHPGLMDLLSVIPGEPQVAGAFNAAIGILDETKSIATSSLDPIQVIKNFVAYLQTLTPQAANAKVFKMASIVLGELDDLNKEKLSESDYDSIVQLEVKLKQIEAAA